jgi:TatD DNase family protein
MIDIGVNLTNNQFDSDLGLVLETAFANGMQAMVLTGTDLESSTASAQICDKYSAQYPRKLFSTAGLHPHDAKNWNSDISNQLEELLKRPNVVAVGETGLDFNRDFSSRDMQIKAFEGQLELAANTGLPLFLHERDAFSTQIEILRSHRDQLEQAVVHCFTGDKTALFAYLDLDLHIGITGWVCDERRGTELAALVPNIPLDRLMVETDAPYLLPRNIVPKPKSRRNEPTYLNWVIQKIAQCYEIEQKEISQQSTANAQAFFGISST